MSAFEIDPAENEAHQNGRSDQDEQRGNQQTFLAERFPYDKVDDENRACIVAKGEKIPCFLTGDLLSPQKIGSNLGAHRIAAEESGEYSECPVLRHPEDPPEQAAEKTGDQIQAAGGQQKAGYDKKGKKGGEDNLKPKE